MTSRAVKTWVRPTPGAPGGLPGFRAGFTAGGSASGGFASAAAVAVGSVAVSSSSALSSIRGAEFPPSHGARLLGGRELFVGP
jgi:hypothetical protein